MNTVLRQTLVVKEPGKLEFQAVELQAGDIAEVLVLLNVKTAGVGNLATTKEERMAAFKALQASASLDELKAREWTQQIRDERQAGH